MHRMLQPRPRATRSPRRATEARPRSPPCRGIASVSSGTNPGQQDVRRDPELVDPPAGSQQQRRRRSRGSRSPTSTSGGGGAVFDDDLGVSIEQCLDVLVRADASGVENEATLAVEPEPGQLPRDFLARSPKEDSGRAPPARSGVAAGAIPLAGARSPPRDAAETVNSRAAVLSATRCLIRPEPSTTPARERQVGVLVRDRVVESHNRRDSWHGEVRQNGRKEECVELSPSGSARQPHEIRKAAVRVRGRRLGGRRARAGRRAARRPTAGSSAVGARDVQKEHIGRLRVECDEPLDCVPGEATEAAPVEPARRVHADPHVSEP